MEKNAGASTAIKKVEPLPEHPGESGESAVEYAFLPLACMSTVLEQNGEAAVHTLRHRLRSLGITPVQSEVCIREELLQAGLVTLNRNKVSATENGVNYVKERRDWIDGTYVSQGRKPKFGETTYRYMVLFEEAAGPEGWVMDRLNTKISPADFVVDMLDVKPANAVRKLHELGSRKLLEFSPERPTAADPMINLRISRFGEARMAALRVMYAAKIHRIEHGANDKINLAHLPEADLQARITAVHDEIGLLRHALGEPHDEVVELEGLNRPEELRETLTGLTATLNDLMKRMDSR